MIEFLVSTLLKDFSVVMLIAAVLLAVVSTRLHAGQHGSSFANQLLAWLLLVAVGLPGIYTFVVHVFFPATSAANIGWAVSPFQYEVGIADLTVGVLGLLAFWGNFSFRLAAVVAATVWYGGDAIGHVRQMIVAPISHPATRDPGSGPTCWFRCCC